METTFEIQVAYMNYPFTSKSLHRLRGQVVQSTQNTFSPIYQ